MDIETMKFEGRANARPHDKKELEKKLTIEDFQLSMTKEQAGAIPVGSTVVPVNRGKEDFRPLKIVSKMPLTMTCEDVETGAEKILLWIDQVVRCVPHGTKPQIRVIDVIVDDFAEKWDGCKNEYKSPAHIIFDRSSIFGVFEEMPSTKGLVLNSPEWHEASERFDEFYEKCERFDFDLADFFAWAMMAGKLDDYNTKQRGGMVAIDSADYPDEASAKGRKYGSFEWAFDTHFTDCEFGGFLKSELEK